MTVLFLHVAPLLYSVYKNSHPPLVRNRGTVGLCTDVLTLPVRLLAFETKQAFLSTNQACLLALSSRSHTYPLDNILSRITFLRITEFNDPMIRFAVVVVV